MGYALSLACGRTRPRSCLDPGLVHARTWPAGTRSPDWCDPCAWTCKHGSGTIPSLAQSSRSTRLAFRTVHWIASSIPCIFPVYFAGTMVNRERGGARELAWHAEIGPAYVPVHAEKLCNDFSTVHVSSLGCVSDFIWILFSTWIRSLSKMTSTQRHT